MRPARHVITTSPSKSAVASYGVGAGSVNIRWRSVSTGMWFAAAGRGTASARTTTPKITHRIARALYIGAPPSRKYPTDCDLRQPGLHLQNNAYRGGRLPARVHRPGRSRRGAPVFWAGALPPPPPLGGGGRETEPPRGGGGRGFWGGGDPSRNLLLGAAVTENRSPEVLSMDVLELIKLRRSVARM